MYYRLRSLEETNHFAIHQEEKLIAVANLNSCAWFIMESNEKPCVEHFTRGDGKCVRCESTVEDEFKLDM